MREVSVDLSDKRPKKLMPETQLHADWAITLACGAVCPYVPTTVEDWDIPDPAGRASTKSVPFGSRSSSYHRPARTPNRCHPRRPHGHQLRLQRLLPGLIERFPELPEQEVRGCGRGPVGVIDAPVRSFVATIAERKARECLPRADAGLKRPRWPDDDQSVAGSFRLAPRDRDFFDLLEGSAKDTVRSAGELEELAHFFPERRRPRRSPSRTDARRRRANDSVSSPERARCS